MQITHLETDSLQIDSDGRLLFAGQALPDLYSEAGSQPSYFYGRELVQNQIAKFRDIMPDTLSLHYAIKANPNPELLSGIAPLVDGLDVASKLEAMLAIKCGIEPHNISFAGPAKQRAELDYAVGAGIVINVESFSEIDRLAEITQSTGLEVSAAIRVNPDFELKAAGMQMSGGPKQFGIDAELVPEALNRISDRGLNFVGFHIFAGSQNLNAEAITECQTKTCDLVLKLGENHLPRSVNIGGGLGVPYFPGDKHLHLLEIRDTTAMVVERLKKQFGQSLEVIMELGRYLVAEAGIYVCEVIDKKISRGTTYVVTNGGLHHHLALSGNFGQVLRKNYPVMICQSDGKVSEHEEEVSIVGPLCTPLDVLGSKMLLPKAEPGDFVVVLQSGAYGFTASPHLFLSHPPPKELVV